MSDNIYLDYDDEDLAYLQEDLDNLENASTVDERLDALYDLRNDLIGNVVYEDDDNEGGSSYILRK